MIVDAVANVGPVSICYDVSSDFRYYEKGVYTRYVKTDGMHVYVVHNLFI